MSVFHQELEKIDQALQAAQEELKKLDGERAGLSAKLRHIDQKLKQLTDISTSVAAQREEKLRQIANFMEQGDLQLALKQLDELDQRRRQLRELIESLEAQKRELEAKQRERARGGYLAQLSRLEREQDELAEQLLRCYIEQLRPLLQRWAGCAQQRYELSMEAERRGFLTLQQVYKRPAGDQFELLAGILRDKFRQLAAQAGIPTARIQNMLLDPGADLGKLLSAAAETETETETEK